MARSSGCAVGWCFSMCGVHTSALRAACSLPAIALLGLLLFQLCGCAAGVSDTYLEAVQVSYRDAPERTLGSGDVIALHVFPEEELSRDYRVSDEGNVMLPYLGPVTVAGLTCIEVESLLTEALDDGYFHNPVVSCELSEAIAHRVFAMGALQSPGFVPFERGLTLSRVVSACGGMKPGAAANRVVVRRQREGEFWEITVPLRAVIMGEAPDLLMWPGDSIYVPQAGVLQ